MAEAIRCQLEVSSLAPSPKELSETSLTSSGTATTDESSIRNDASPVKTRASAKEQVANAWRTHRLELHGENDGGNEALLPHGSRHAFSLCVVLQKAVHDWQKNRRRTTTAATADLRSSITSEGSAGRTPPSRTVSNDDSFPSVLRILQQEAIRQHVEEQHQEAVVAEPHHEREEKEEVTVPLRAVESPMIKLKTKGGAVGKTFHDNWKTTTTTPQPAAMDALSVLPAGYDWNRAVLQTVRRRSRAFLLLDVAAIIRTLVEWKRKYQAPIVVASSTMPSKLHFLYTVQCNADAKLLQLLRRSQVGLVATSQWDVERCCSLQGPGPTGHPVVYDNAATTGQSDGYLRTLVLDAGQTTVTVDGPDEVHRIQAAVQRLHQRRAKYSSALTPIVLNFLLRLPPVDIHRSPEEDVQVWQSLVVRTCLAISQVNPLSQLEGVSFDINDCTVSSTGASCLLSPFPSTVSLTSAVAPSVSTNGGGSGEEESTLAIRTKDRLALCLDRLLSLLDSDPSSLGTGGRSLLWRIDMTGLQTSFPPGLVSWWQQLSCHEHVRNITVDVSVPLVAPAAALCTRIIGAKEEIGRDHVSRRHYYIDDGCYGSLYQGASKHQVPLRPLPLLASSVGGNTNAEDSEDAPHLDCSCPPSASMVHTSTVWGPTCDGLDKVCEDIPLPALRRDDWLVFPNRGTSSSEGLGTAFNGFNPPDTVYCVLGYFS
jgi:diaminopimelate decarboxylase